MGNCRLLKRIMVGTLANPDKRGQGVKEKECTDCVADDLRLFRIGDGERWKTVALDPGKWWEMVTEGDHTFMATKRWEVERAAEFRRRSGNHDGGRAKSFCALGD